MPRRRRREPDIIGAIGGIIGIVFILAMLASLGAQNPFGILLQGTFALVCLALFLVIVGIVLVIGFFVIRFLIARNRGLTSFPIPTYAHPAPPTFSEPPPPQQQDFVSQLRETDWYQFEKVVGLIYESQGYTLHRRGGANPDGGIDLIIEKDGERTAVQCKRWKKWKVDVPKVRELFGAMTHEGLHHGLIVALNGFTLEAKQLAVEHNIDIVHDENLAMMIDGLTTTDQLKVQAMLNDTTKHCPKCEATMIWRTPKPGKNWTPFWGCSRYPQCHGRLQGD